MDEQQLKLILEALLMSAREPLSLDQLLSVFADWQKPSAEAVQAALRALGADYQNRAVELRCLANGYSIKTRTDFAPWVAALQLEKPAKYSRAFLETLAIIAYKQPVTRADIEEIRGVVVNSQILKALLEREWIRVAGHRDVPGKPAVYVTTKVFLDYFNLASLDDLPKLMSVEGLNQDE